MNGVNAMRRRSAAGWLQAAAESRRNGVKLAKISSPIAASFFDEARRYVEWARLDLGYAKRAGWKLP